MWDFYKHILQLNNESILYKATERTEWDTAKLSAPLQKDKGDAGHGGE